MNARILELIKNPEIIQKQDLDLLNAEIKVRPYLQNIRAIHLAGIHQYKPEDYQKELSVTAAYTTDKKILYQLINKKADEGPTEFSAETSPEKVAESGEEPIPGAFNEVSFVPKPTAKPVFVKGSLNRILFEGEEDFLERETEKIDLESTVESGTLVTQDRKTETLKETPEIEFTNEPEFKETPDAETFARETIVHEDKISGEEQVIENADVLSFHGVDEFLPKINNDLPEKEEFKEAGDAESFSTETIINENEIKEEEPKIESSKISFHGTEEFLPNIKITPNIDKTSNSQAPKSGPNKQEIEMQRLIADVEAKVKASKKEKTPDAEPVKNKEINFSETQSFEVSAPKKESSAEKTQPPTEAEINSAASEFQNKHNVAPPQPEKEKTSSQSPAPQTSAWKPMQFAGNTPDSLIEKKSAGKPIPSETSPAAKTASPEKQTEERPAFKVSVLDQQVSAVESQKTEAAEEEAEKTMQEEQPNPDSNVPHFINTWQNWLKIERKEPAAEKTAPVSKVEVKNTVIEKFIEKEPKISKLKEESDFVVKEKGSNISHLMTETLANLYIEQKLYAKAIQAYETLITKHPQKEKAFREKIQEIKELRKNP